VFWVEATLVGSRQNGNPTQSNVFWVEATLVGSRQNGNPTQSNVFWVEVTFIERNIRLKIKTFILPNEGF
jgi:hypothetical protein